MTDTNPQKSFQSAPFGYALLQIVPKPDGRSDDFTFIEVNAEFERITGLQSIDIPNCKSSDVLSSINIFCIDSCLEKNNEGQAFTESCMEWFSPSAKRWYKVIFSSLGNDGYTLILFDIHDLKKLKEDLQELALVASKTTDVVVITDSMGKISWVNDAFEILTGYSLEEIKGKKPGTFLQGKDTDPSTRQQLADAIANYRSVHVEILNYAKSGKSYWLDLKIDPIVGDDGTVGKFIAIEREITDHKMAEETLQLALIKQKAINKLFEASTQIKQLDVFLQKMLDILLRIPFLNILPRIGVFTLADDQVLQLKAHKNLSPEIQKDCNLVPFGKCLCGKAALTRKPQHASNLDHNHEIMYEGITEHGHYNIPIVSQNKTLGVIVVYLPVGHQHQEEEVEFLTAVAEIVAAKINNVNTEESLVKNELKYRTIFENVQDVFYQTDISGLVTEISPSIGRYSGYSVDEIVGTQISKFYNDPNDRIKLMEALMQKKEVVDFEVRLRTKDERLVYTSVNCHLMFGKDNQVVGVEGSLRDISERKKTDQINKIQFNIATAVTATKDMGEFIELIRVELNKYIDASNFFVALYDPKKDTLSSPFFKDEFDEIKEWPANKSLTGLVVHENRALLLHQKDVAKLELEGKVQRLGGHSLCWLGVPLRSDGNAIGAFVVQSYHDQNAYNESDLELLEFVSNQICIALRRKKDEDEIALLSKSISQSPVSIVITDTAGAIEYVNPKFTQVTGYSSEEAIGRNPNVLKSGTQPPETYSALWDAIRNGNQWTGELHNKRKNGEFFWEFASISPIVDISGKVHHYLAVKEDITERKRAEDRTRDLTSRLTTLIANLPSGILLETPQRKIQQTNLKFCELFGIDQTPETLVGYDCKEALEGAKLLFIHPELFIERIGQILAEKKPVLNEELQLTDGRVFQRDFVPILTADKEFENLWHYRDITHQKQAEQDLKKQASLQKILMDISSKYINMPVAQIESEIMTSLRELALFVEADRAYVFSYDWANQVANNTHEWTGDGISSYKNELQNISLLKMPKWAESHSKGLSIIIHDTLNLPFDDFLKNILLGHEVKSLIAIPMMNDGKCTGFVGFDSVNSLHTYSEAEEILLSVFSEMLVNVRHRATLEKNLIAEKLNADNASKAKSEFLANMSHEIRTPLNGVIGFTDLLLKTALNKTQLQYAENANISGISLLGIINDILDFSKIEAGKMELDLIKTDIIELVEQASDIIKYHAAKKGLELLLNINPNIPRFAVVDPVRLKQILVNLLGNAIKFTEAGEVEIKLTFVQKNASTGQFRFSVRDTGIGISDDQQNKLFKAFTQADTTTTRKFGGTGLGLTISNMLAQKMGGEIQIISSQGKGSNFFFTVETEFEIGEKLDSNNSEIELKRVLVIDDNDNNRLILEHTFNNWGIEYSGIDNGLSAIKLISHSKPFDLIIIDYHMPFLNGIDTIKMIREKLHLSPQMLPVILLHSSSDDMEIYEECKKLGVRFNLTKPIKSQELFHYLKNISKHPDFQHTDKKPQETAPATIEKTFKAKPVILVAEDVRLNMILITTLIKQMVPNVEILEATNGQEVLDLYIVGKPTLIFMDIQMPLMDGIEATLEIRSYERGKSGHIPIVALTAGSIKGEEEKCMNVGMDSFLTKPIVQKDLVKVLEKYLSGVAEIPKSKEQ